MSLFFQIEQANQLSKWANNQFIQTAHQLKIWNLSWLQMRTRYNPAKCRLFLHIRIRREYQDNQTCIMRMSRQVRV